jgi:hypothetical protein
MSNDPNQRRRSNPGAAGPIWACAFGWRARRKIEVEKWAARDDVPLGSHVYWLITVRAGHRAARQDVAGSQREAAKGNVDTEVRSPPCLERSSRQAVGTFLLDKGFLSLPPPRGGAPAQDRLLKASLGLRNEWARLRLDCCVVAGLGRWTSVLLVLPRASKGTGVRLPRSSSAMVRVWMLGDWP